jgi:DNA-binding XRE family transcriptional regulator
MEPDHMEATYLPFQLEDYVDNPIDLARIKARVSQSELARCLNVSQACISKIERQEKVKAELLSQVSRAMHGGRGKA